MIAPQSSRLSLPPSSTSANSRSASLQMFGLNPLSVRPRTSYGITELSEHEADGGKTEERKRAVIAVFQSRARRRHRLSHAIVRSTIQRLGSTTKPLACLLRLTMSTARLGIASAAPVWKIGPA